jgi:hypothetical protein
MRKITRRDPQYKLLIYHRLELLRKTPSHPLLRLHKLSNINYYSISIDYSIRIILLMDNDHCYLLSIGSHDEVY